MPFDLKGIIFARIMRYKPAINQSQNVLLIQLDEVKLENIIEKKLNGLLKEPSPILKNLLKTFYNPAEQALIEIVLADKNGNQLKAAKWLGINRNTLKKKILTYQLDIKKISSTEQNRYRQNSPIFLTSLSSLDLLSACYAKLWLDYWKNLFPPSRLIKHICLPVEKKILLRVLEYCKGNQIRTSDILGINRNTLKRKIKLKNLKKAKRRAG